jgi:hypothetical protein
MRRTLAALALVLVATVAALLWHGAPEASAVAPSQVVGVYRLKLKGDGWLRGTTEPYRVERIGGGATLLLAAGTAGRLHAEIRLDPEFTGGLLDLATPATAFVGEGYMVGDSLTVIDTGAPTYVNAITLTFLKDGARIVGHWLSAYPPAAADAGPGSAVGIGVSGRKLGKREPGSNGPKPALR